MSFQEINTFILTLLDSFGGGAAVVTALTLFLGKIQAKRIHEKDKYSFRQELEQLKQQHDIEMQNIINRYQKSIEHYKFELDTQATKAKIYNDTQFKHYNTLYSALIDLKLIANKLWENAEQSKVKILSKKLKEAIENLEKSRILIAEDDYLEMKRLIEIFSNYRVGKQKLIDIRNSNLNQIIDMYKVEEIINGNLDKLNNMNEIIEKITISIKRSIKGTL
ncbi:MAG: hypothetical protein FH761_07495 [Firmicutes bacterium]|nr:hypothetical protein [Bacillota bacterium]